MKAKSTDGSACGFGRVILGGGLGKKRNASILGETSRGAESILGDHNSGCHHSLEYILRLSNINAQGGHSPTGELASSGVAEARTVCCENAASDHTENMGGWDGRRVGGREDYRTLRLQ